MFCVFLQNTPPKEDILVTIIHSDIKYSFSRDLSLRHSSVLADLIIKNSEDQINLDYTHDLDDFQLICDLFNYKRIFITQDNIEFLEFAGNYLQIPILIKKTIKYRNQYNDFLKNPIFMEIDKLHHQIFSIFKESNLQNTNSDSDYYYYDIDIDNENKPNQNINNNYYSKDGSQITDGISNKKEISNKEDEIETSKEKNKLSEETDSKQKEKTEINEKNANVSLSNPTIQYPNEFSTSVIHLIFSACLSNPLNITQYFQIIINDSVLLYNFINLINYNQLSHKINNFFYDILIDLLKDNIEDQLEVKSSYERYLNRNNEEINEILDTNLKSYLNEYCTFLIHFYEILKPFDYLAALIQKDDIDNLQSIIATNTKISTDQTIFLELFYASMMASSLRCFKYLLLNFGPLFGCLKVTKKMIQSAIIGGNIEIFRLMLEKYEGKPYDFIYDSILFHKDGILNWIIENHCQLLSIYNSCCSKVLYGNEYISQKWYKCKKCHTNQTHGCCKFCAKHCHLNKDSEKVHHIKYCYISASCFCDDDCQLSKNIGLDNGNNKKFIEIDDLILLSVFSLNTNALKILIENGGYLFRCRDRITKKSYILNDAKLLELIESMKGYRIKHKEEKISDLSRFMMLDIDNMINNRYHMTINFIRVSLLNMNDDANTDDEEKEDLVPHLMPQVLNLSNEQQNDNNNIDEQDNNNYINNNEIQIENFNEENTNNNQEEQNNDNNTNI